MDMPAFSTNLQRTQEDLPSWHLVDAENSELGRVVTTQEKMFDVLQTLMPLGWRGAVTCNPDSTCRLELNADSPTRTVIASSGDRLVIDFDGLKLLTESQATEYFTTGGE
jgi:hypothetical protein